MLGKLLKYDFKYIVKFLAIFYGLATFFAILTKVFLNIENSLVFEIIGSVCQGAMISMMFSIVVNNLMRMWVRFKHNLYGDESYLTHTLPVKKTDIYLSKILCSVITLCVSIMVVVANLFIAYYSKGNLESLKNILIHLSLTAQEAW